MKAFMNHLAFEFKYVFRDKTLLFMNYLFPLIFYVMMGLVMNSVNPVFYKTIIPSMIVFAILVSTLLGMPTPLLQGRESGIYRSYKINGIPSLNIMLIPVLTTIFHLAIVSVVITLTAPAIFKGVMPEGIGVMIIGFLALAIACTGLGALIAVVSQNSRVTIILAQIIFVPSMILGGIMMPSSILPETMGKVSKIFPSTYAMNVFNSIIPGEKAAFSTAWSLMILVLGGILAFCLSLYLFRWDNNDKKKNNLLALLALAPYLLGIILL